MHTITLSTLHRDLYSNRLFLTVLVSLKVTADEFKNLPTPSKNLILTPLINAGNISEAKSLANVTLFPGVTSYSGFLTVDEECKSHLFFWFFPAATGNKSAPLFLWHGGGPGTSALFALFQGTGPVILDKTDDSWTLNNNSWTQSRSVLYLDSPVELVSVIQRKAAYAMHYSRDDVADGTINALRQFFELFQKSIHVDTASSGRVFQTSSRVVYENLLSDLYKSVGDLVENLLDAGTNSCSLLVSLTLVPHTTIEKFLDELRWKGTNELRSKGNSWWDNGQVVGYGKIVGNLTYLMFRNTGIILFDQPEWTLDLILRFTN
ncbi:putative serine carboxypeptidase CPVL [Orchesella cincta]|uniref:Putative serine carboxypeptidase CPVL n=1 Tax=Orchesella cincta TaxID=48709 RepID=A0A1D2M3D2_ORCCI|nr:putative serine carboxypeptidase CPVL [Orchesella cincta]